MSADDDAPEPARAVRDEAAPPPPPASSGVPLWAVRIIAFGLLFALIALLSHSAWRKWHPPLPPGSGPPDQHVVVRAQREVHVRIVVDGKVNTDRTLANGESIDVTGRDRVEVDLPAVEAARVQYNGETIVPQGRQDEARRLVFIDDVGP